MTPGELLRKEAANWLDQAARDRTSAKALAEVEPSRSVFHSQQAADLGSQCKVADPTLEPILREVEELTDYATAFRYPDAPYEPDTTEAEEALTIATRLCDEVQLRIPSSP